MTNCHRLNLKAADGKHYLTDVADIETIIKIAQLIPDVKSESLKRFKLWLAEAGYEKAKKQAEQELLEKERLSIRKEGIPHRKEWTKQLQKGGAKEGWHYAVVTNACYQQWSGMTAKEYKEFKRLDSKDNLRDHMTAVELTLTRLSEVCAKEIAEINESAGLGELLDAAKNGGNIARTARLGLEEKTNRNCLSRKNYLKLIR